MSTKNLSPVASSRLKGVLATIAVQVIVVGLVVAIFPVRMWVLRQAIPTDYFDPEIARDDTFEQVSGPLYAFRHGLNRSAVVVSDAGIFVFDPFNQKHAARLRAELDERFPGKPVQTVFYSHNHLDHIRGAAELQPRKVVGHREVMSYVQDWAHTDILPVTDPTEGDVTMSLGGVTVQLLYLPRSHTNTLYAYYFPEQRAVFAPDTAFIESFPPFGLPDWYYPGYIRALDRIGALDFDHCIPSHFERGTKQDFLAFRTMMIDYRSEAERIVTAMGGEPSNGEDMRRYFGPAYLKLREKYGTWRGFDAMFVPHFVGQIGGAYLGY